MSFATVATTLSVHTSLLTLSCRCIETDVSTDPDGQGTVVVDATGLFGVVVGVVVEDGVVTEGVVVGGLATGGAADKGLVVAGL